MIHFAKIILFLMIFYESSSLAQNYWEFCGLNSDRSGHVFLGPSDIIYGTTIVGLAGYEPLYYSTNNGDYWESMHLYPVTAVTSVVFNNSGYTFISTPLGIYRCTYYGEDMTNIGLTDLPHRYMSVNSTGYIFAGGNSALYKSTDNGNSWINTYLSADVRSIACGLNDDVYVATATGMFKSTDDGGSWSAINTNLTNTDVYIVAISAENIIFIGTSQGGVFRSDDGGNTWINISLNIPAFFKSSTINSIGYVFMGTSDLSDSYGIYKSTDNGNSWSLFNSGIPHLAIEGLIVNSYDIVFTGTRDYGIYRTIHPTPVELSDFTGLARENKVKLNWSTASEINNHGFEIQRSLNKTVWVTIGFKEGYGTTEEEHKYQFIDNINSTGANKLYYRLKQVDYNDGFEYSDIVEIEIISTEFYLRQNYPNPFNPSTNIAYSIPHLGLVTLKVYDVLGNEVATLINEEKSAGRYNIKFDGSKLASGIYFYILNAENYSQSRKMILLK